MDEEGETAPGQPGQASQVTRPAPRPFPAIDPEPAHRYTWRTARQAGIALVALAVAAGAVVLGTRIAQTRAPAPARPGPAVTPAPFADGDGTIVFEQQPSGLLGTARPDGRGPALAKATGALQGNDLAVASPHGRYLVNAEGQLVTLGAAGPASVTSMSQLTSDLSASGYSMGLSFADGGRSVVALECDTITNGPVSDDGQKWIAHLYPTSGTKGIALGQATYATGDPAASGAIVAVPVITAAAPSCESPIPADSAIELITAGKPARVIVTAAALLRTAGWKPGTPVDLAAIPSPDGARLIVTMEQHASQPGRAVTSGPPPPSRAAWFLVGRSGAVASPLPALASGGQLAWSPDGGKIATCSAGNGKPSSVSVLTVSSTSSTAAGATAQTVKLPGRRDVYCDQLLWSPDGTQLIYSAVATTTGLTQAANLQHGWTVVDLRTGGAHDVAAPGQPAAWLPGRGGAA